MPVNFSYEKANPGRYNDDEIVTFDSPYEDPEKYRIDDFHPSHISNSRQVLLENPPFLRFDNKLQVEDLGARPQTENIISRYDTNELFTFEEDEFCTKMSVQERFQHPRWQVRKQLYVDIADSLRAGRFLLTIETETGVFEYFEPLLKNMAWDSNLTSQLEGLQTILVYVKLVPAIKNSLLFLADELIQKCALTKQKSGELVQQIVVELMGRDGEGMLLHYVIKRFTAKNPKEACFAITCAKLALPILPTSENIGKNLVAGLNKTLSHSGAEVRTCSMMLAADLYCYISDSVESYIKNLDFKSMQIKEFKENLEGKEKISEKWNLFTKEKIKAEISDLLILEDSTECVTIDLLTLVPEGFFDIAYSNEIKINREKLLKFNHSLEVPGLILEKKEYQSIVNSILHLIESNNTLIYTEAIKLVEILIPKVPKSFTFKYKQCLQFLSDKFKEKKKIVISSINNIFHLFRLHEVCSFENIIEILLENSTHKVPQVREYSVNWIISEIQKLPSMIDLLEIHSTSFPYEKILESIVTLYGGKILAIASKDTIGTVRDAATKLLSLLKSLVQYSTQIDSLLSKLPKNKVFHTDKAIEVEPEHIKETSPLPQDFFVEMPKVTEKDEETVWLLIEEIKKYSEGTSRFEGIMSKIKSLESESAVNMKSPIVSTIVWVFFKINPGKIGNKLENLMLDLNALIEGIIREIGSFEVNLIPKLVKILLQFPIFITKSNHKSIESTLDVLFMLSNQLKIISSTISFISNLRLKKPRATLEEKAIVCLKFATTWLLKKVDKAFARNHSENCPALIDEILDIRENDTVFSEHFIKELSNSKNTLSIHMRKVLATVGEASPLRSRSPNLSRTEIPIDISPEDQNPILREVKELHSAMKSGNSHQKMSALNRLMKLVEFILASGQKPHAMLPLDLEDLETFIKDIIFLCTKYKNYSHEPTAFEELQQTTIQALTSLRVIISDRFAESVFKLLLYHLPVKNSNSHFSRSFNSSVYQLLSDWLSHLSTGQVILIVGETLALDSVFNIHVVYIHVLQWFLEVELRLGNFELGHLEPIVPFIAAALGGGPLNNSHPLSQNTRQVIVDHTQIFMEYLEEIFTADSLYSFFEEKLVNSGRLYSEFKEWRDTCRGEQKKTNENAEERKSALKHNEASPEIVEDIRAETFRVIKNETSPEEKDSLMAKLEEITEQHEETRRNLVEVNKEYMTQVTLNYKLMQRLEEASKIKDRQHHKPDLDRQHEKKAPLNARDLIDSRPPKEASGSPIPRAVESKRTPSFRPCTNFEEILTSQNLAQDPPQPNAKIPVPSHISLFEPEVLDQPVVPFYLQQSEIYNFQNLLLSAADPPEISSHLLKVYSTLPVCHKKPFLQFLCNSLEVEDILAAISAPILKSIVYSILQFCVMEKMGSMKNQVVPEDTELTDLLQKLVAVVMESKEVTMVMVVLVQCVSEALPESFYLTLSADNKIYLKLVLKCMLKVAGAVKNTQKNIRVFDVLLEINRLFASHPPEELHSDCADVAEFEHMFKVIRAVSDAVVAVQPEKAVVFVKFISNSSGNRTIFLKYLSAVLSKKYNISN